jgi:hypothetical protein
MSMALPLPADWMEVIWCGRRDQLDRLIARERAAGWAVDRAVLLALGLLLAGCPERADDLLLEADAEQPQLGLVPDRWGLWPQPVLDADGLPESARRASELVTLYGQWRHHGGAAGPDPDTETALLGEWQRLVGDAVATDPAGQWRLLLEPDSMVLLARLLQKPGAGERLRDELEPLLVQAVGETVVEQHPIEALQFWSGISRRCPSWDYGRLKAADLSLQIGRLGESADHLAAATPEQRRNPWLHDIEARLALAQGKSQQAVACWDEAITAAIGDGELVELLRQRRREAEWKLELVGANQSTGPSGDVDLDRFAAQLEDLAQRFGVVLPQPLNALGPESPADPDSFAAFLDHASGRLALAG